MDDRFDWRTESAPGLPGAASGREASALRAMIALGALLFAAVPALVAPPRAGASCGSASCPLDGSAYGAPRRAFSFDLSFQTIDQDRLKTGTRGAQVGALASPEDEVRTLNRSVTARAVASLSPRWTLSASVPYVHRLHRHIANEPGGPEPFEWRYSGLGDVMLLGGWTALGPSPERLGPGSGLSVTLRAGLKAPTGLRHVPAVQGEEPEPSARPGTGSWDFVAGAHAMVQPAARTLAGTRVALPVFATVLARANGRGTEAYRVGNNLEASLGASYPLTPVLRLQGQLNARLRARDDVGETDALRDNTGGTAVYASPGLRLDVGRIVSFSGYVQIPIYERVNRIQLVAPALLWFGASYRLP